MKKEILIVLLGLSLVGCAARVRHTSTTVPDFSKASEVVRILASVGELTKDPALWGKHCLPEHLRDKKHNDWPFLLNNIPRWFTAYCGDGPDWPSELTLRLRKPIPPPGTETYHLLDRNGAWRPYYARTWATGLHFRVGYRWDDVDFYYNFIPPWLATLKFVPVEGPK